MSDLSPVATADLLGPVEVGPVAHGGHCVARLPLEGEPDGAGGGRVVFVRHALPGERVMVRVTDDSHAKFWRGDAVEVLEPSPDRVVPPCPVARPGLCGGCDFQHVDLAAQRRLKTAVVAEQLQRLAGIEWDGEVVGVDTPETVDGLGWRTRMRYHVDDDGRAALRAHRSHALVPLPDGGCPIASPRTPDVTGRTWPAGAELVAVSAAEGEALLVDGRVRLGEPEVTEQAAGRRWQVAADGFWQVHPAAADTLVDAVLDGLRPRAGERAFDLYCGVGLFAGALAAAGCQVWGLETGHQAILAARRNLEEFGDRVRLRADRVERGNPHLAVPGRPRRPRPATQRGRQAGGRRRAEPPAARGGLRGLRPRRPRPRPGHRRPSRLPAGQHRRVRPVPHDPPRRVRRHPGACRLGRYHRHRRRPGGDGVGVQPTAENARSAMVSRSRVPRSLGVGLATAFLASGVVTACASEQETYTEDVYCATEDGTVIDEKYCDDERSGGFGGGFIWIGGFGGGWGPGYRLPAGQRTASMPYNDAAARQRAGLPATGRVTGSGGLGGKVTKTRASKGGGFGGSAKGGSSS